MGSLSTKCDGAYDENRTPERCTPKHCILFVSRYRKTEIGELPPSLWWRGGARPPVEVTLENGAGAEGWMLGCFVTGPDTDSHNLCFLPPRPRKGRRPEPRPLVARKGRRWEEEEGSVVGCRRAAVRRWAVQRERGEGCKVLDAGKGVEAQHKAFSRCQPTTSSRSCNLVGSPSDKDEYPNGAVWRLSISSWDKRGEAPRRVRSRWCNRILYAMAQSREATSDQAVATGCDNCKVDCSWWRNDFADAVPAPNHAHAF